MRETVEEIGRELSLCMRYYTVSFRGQRPETGTAIGGGAGLASMLADVGEAASLDLTPFDPFGALSLDPQSDTHPWRSTVALSLASGEPGPAHPAAREAA